MKYVSRRTPVSALLLSLALGLCGSAAARDQEPSRARKTPQAASKAAPKVKPQPAPAPRALPRQSASAEARLLEIYRLIGSAQADVALGKAESLVRDVPNFQLAQLVYGDLLLARTHALPTMGNAPAALAGRAHGAAACAAAARGRGGGSCAAAAAGPEQRRHDEHAATLHQRCSGSRASALLRAGDRQSGCSGPWKPWQSMQALGMRAVDAAAGARGGSVPAFAGAASPRSPPWQSRQVSMRGIRTSLAFFEVSAVWQVLHGVSEVPCAA